MHARFTGSNHHKNKNTIRHEHKDPLCWCINQGRNRNRNQVYYKNNHRHKKSLLKVFSENFLIAIKVISNRLHKQNTETILFYPQYPSRRSVIYKILNHLHYNITNNPNIAHQHIVYWDDTTYRKPDRQMSKMIGEKGVINKNCTDISKSKVESVFHEVFGYSYVLDCTSHHGQMVKKSEINASHDGEIISGPVHPEEGVVYQKLINNGVDNELVVDMRVPIIDETIPFVFLKYKPKKDRFAHYRKTRHKRKTVERYQAHELLSEKEIEKTISFCKKIGLDYGEVDILRDTENKKIYIIDVNNTPNGPPDMGASRKKDNIGSLADAFAETFLETRAP